MYIGHDNNHAILYKGHDRHKLRCLYMWGGCPGTDPLDRCTEGIVILSVFKAFFPLYHFLFNFIKLIYSKSLACFLHMLISLVLFAGSSLTVALPKDCEMVGFSPKYSIMKKLLNCCEVENYHLDSAIHALVYFFYHIADHVLVYLIF